MTRLTSRGLWRRTASVVFVAAAFLFLGLLVGRQLGELREHEWVLRPGLLALAFALHISGLVWGVWVWKLLLRRMAVEIGFLELARVWFVAAIGRYIPGKIWQFVGAAHLGSGSGIPAAVTVASLAAHTGVFLVAALLSAVYLLPLSALPLDPAAVAAARWLAPLLLLLVHPGAIRFALRLLGRVVRRDLGGWVGGWGDGLVLVGLAGLGWGMTGVALYLFFLSLTPLPGASALVMIGMNALSFVIGNAVFIAPAGLGAKEGALAALLLPYVPAPVAALLAVAARLWTVMGEAIPALLLLRARPPSPPR